ncbi:MAG: tRNA (adenosine(37)-N6)-dimethylallyltransferase MiaA [Spirochaetes bacterium]|nr:tRNA (adenosine(37)-N6)-dimethylallyltransferase MiaA [Spirochaetota bacterium]
MSQKYIFIVGPTASGKTYIAEELARRLSLPIVSIDSMQIYKEMNVGTAKPSIESQQKVKYFGIDIVYPNEWFSVGDYYYYISNLLSIKEDKKLNLFSIDNGAIFAGGTGLYFDSIVKGISPTLPRNENIRRELEQREKLEGLNSLFRELELKDREYSNKISPNDKKRIMRALEVIYITDKKFSSFHDSEYFRKEGKNSLFNKNNSIFFGIDIEKEKLVENIRKRIHIMIKNGLIDEVYYLWLKYIDKNKPSFKGIGYFHLISLYNFIFFIYILMFWKIDENFSSFFDDKILDFIKESLREYLIKNYFNKREINKSKIIKIILKYIDLNKILVKNYKETINKKLLNEDLKFLFSDTYIRDLLEISFDFGNIILEKINKIFENKNIFLLFKIETIKKWIEDNSILFDCFIKRIELDTINFAKRQLVWFKKHLEIKWLSSELILKEF